MDKIARLRQEIERLKKENDSIKCDSNKAYCLGYGDAFVDLLPFLDTLSEEPDKSLEEASYDAVCRIFGCDPMYFGNKAEITARECDYLFRAGAEWQASQMPMPEDTVLFNKGVAEGRRLEMDDMLGDAISCEVDWYDGPILNYPIDKLCEVLSKMDVDVGDKVRIVVLKEEE